MKELVQTPQEKTTQKNYFYPMSVPKLVIMQFCTFFLYTIFWLMQNWDAVKKAEGSNISPFWRAINYFAPVIIGASAALFLKSALAAIIVIFISYLISTIIFYIYFYSLLKRIYKDTPKKAILFTVLPWVFLLLGMTFHPLMIIGMVGNIILYAYIQNTINNINRADNREIPKGLNWTGYTVIIIFIMGIIFSSINSHHNITSSHHKNGNITA